MKHLLLTTIAAVLLVGCGESQQSAPSPETTPVEPVRQFGVDVGMIVPVAKAAKIGPPTAKESIHRAAETGNIEAVKQHLAAGTDVNVKGGFADGTPLHYAAANGHKEIAELLIEKGADLNAKDEDGGTPLDVAIQFKELEIADLIRVIGGKTAEELKAEGK